MNIEYPTIFEIEEAKEKAFEASYGEEWIDQVEQIDHVEIMKKIWAVVTDNVKSPEAKYLDIRHILDVSATNVSNQYAEEMWGLYV